VQIEQAAQRVQRGNEQLVKAIEYQKKIRCVLAIPAHDPSQGCLYRRSTFTVLVCLCWLRKKYCCIAVVVVIVLCILAGVFGGLSKRL
jgi:hypothetical protein